MALLMLANALKFSVVYVILIILIKSLNNHRVNFDTIICKDTIKYIIGYFFK